MGRFLLLFIAVGATVFAYGPASYSALADIDFSPYAGGEDILFVHRSLERWEAKLLGQTELSYSKHPIARSWRFSELISIWLPLNYLAMVTQHEIFGHGYRIRNIGPSLVRLDGYQIGVPPPYGGGGGSTSYYIHHKLTSTDETSIAMAGVESTAILANLIKWKWLQTRLIDAKQSVLYLLSESDLGLYISSIKTVRTDPEHDLSGHDIHGYLFWLNLTYTQRHLSSGRLRSLSWINLADPFLFYSVWAWFHYLYSGRDTKIPMFPLGNKLFYLFSARLGLTPFGPEYFWEQFFEQRGRVYYGYLKAGRHSLNNYFGLGLFIPQFWKKGRWEWGLRFDAWRQPNLLLLPADISVIDITENGLPPETPLYPAAEQREKRNGFAASLLLAIRKNERFAFEGELGGKTKGFLPGYSLRQALTARGGFSLRF